MKKLKSKKKKFKRIDVYGIKRNGSYGKITFSEMQDLGDLGKF